MSRDSINRIIRTGLQGGAAIPVVVAVIALLRAAGVPVSLDLEDAIKGLLVALGAFVAATAAWNAVEEATGKSVLKHKH